MWRYLRHNKTIRSGGQTGRQKGEWQVRTIDTYGISGAEAQDPQKAGDLEWLVTNHLGGFASGTVAGMPTRRYHALLVAAPAPEARCVLLAQVLETVTQKGSSWSLGALRFPDVYHPQGFRYLHRFQPYPYPTWIYAAAGWLLEKSLAMLPYKNVTVVHYRLLDAPGPLLLTLQPFVAMRHYHHVQQEKAGLYRQTAKSGWQVIQGPPGLPELYLASEAIYQKEETWWRRITYRQEAERGLEDEEDWFAPGFYNIELHPGDSVRLVAGSGDDTGVFHSGHLLSPAEAAGAAFRRSRARQAELLAKAGRPEGAAAQLVLAADDFIIKRGELVSVIAGYPWFTDWGRDTMISFPGLFLATGRADEGGAVLTTFASAAEGGLIPNRFPDINIKPEFNAVDASLWFIYACWQYVKYTGEMVLAHNLWPVIRQILTSYRQGTRFGIRAEKNGLLRAGEEGYALTWMDAKAGDWVVTPRRGLAVEVNALWYNALRSAADLGAAWDPAFCYRCLELAGEVEKHFVPTFWLPEEGYLADVVADDGTVDKSLRPNQLLAVSLPFPLLSGHLACQVVETVHRHLLTPLGPATLSPLDADFQPLYRGNQRTRDAAYHQGCVWPWLMGPFISAYRRVYGRSDKTAAISRRLLAPLLDHLYTAGLGHISEICDGAPPHWPKGCPWQAWSTAEMLRLWVEEFGRAPLEMTL